MGNEDDAIELLEQTRDELEERLARVNAAIAALRNGTKTIHSQAMELKPGQGRTVSPIQQICQYLKEKSKPVSQEEIIRTVGDLRQKLYPNRNGHYANVWRALEYHVRHGKLISCIDPRTGMLTQLSPLPPRPGGIRKLPNDASLYLQANYFVLKEECVNEMLHVRKEDSEGNSAESS